MRMKAKTILDVGMMLLFLLQMAYHLMGDSLHEWMGILLFALLILHNILDWRWYAGLGKGGYTPVRSFQTAINLLLLISCLGLMFSGILLSSAASAFLPIQAAILGRKLHMVFTTWSFLLLSAHVGLHWNMAISVIKKRVRNWRHECFLAARFTALLLSADGLYAFLLRKMPQRMFLLTEYAFFDYEEPFLFFMIHSIAILFLFACPAYYIVKRLGIKARISMK